MYNAAAPIRGPGAWVTAGGAGTGLAVTRAMSSGLRLIWSARTGVTSPGGWSLSPLLSTGCSLTWSLNSGREGKKGKSKAFLPVSWVGARVGKEHLDVILTPPTLTEETQAEEHPTRAHVLRDKKRPAFVSFRHSAKASLSSRDRGGDGEEFGGAEKNL